MKKLIKCLALLITCVLLASCDRGRGKLYIYKDLTIQDVDYWANYETGDSIAFVNEQNDSMVFILERYNRYTDPTQEEDGVDKEGTDDFYDIQRSIEIGIKGKSNHNYLNLPIEMEQLMTIVNQVFRLEVVITEIDHPRSKTWHVFSRKAYFKDVVTDDGCMPDSIILESYDDRTQNFFDGCEVVKDKGAIWWLDTIGHTWTLVDLMER